jgi:hypothetical protein
MVMGRLDGAVRVDRYGGGRPQLPVVELTASELNSAHMQVSGVPGRAAVCWRAEGSGCGWLQA